MSAPLRCMTKKPSLNRATSPRVAWNAPSMASITAANSCQATQPVASLRLTSLYAYRSGRLYCNSPGVTTACLLRDLSRGLGPVQRVLQLGLGLLRQRRLQHRAAVAT